MPESLLDHSVDIVFPPFVFVWNFTSVGKIWDNVDGSREHLLNELEITKSKEDPSSSSFKPGYRFHFAFAALPVLALMVSSDSTAVSVPLPVCTCHHFN